MRNTNDRLSAYGLPDVCSGEATTDNKKRFSGKGVLKAVENVNSIIAPNLLKKKDLDLGDLLSVDKYMVETLDQAKNEWGWTKSKLGANAILSVSIALSKAIAAEKNIPLYKYYSELSGNNKNDTYILPVPCLNVINGGKHAGNMLPHQEFMLIPFGAPTFREALRIGCETFHTLKSIIKKKYGSQSTGVGDEGGFAPVISSDLEALELISLAIKEAGHEGKIGIALDLAASEMYDESTKK